MLWPYTPLIMEIPIDRGSLMTSSSNLSKSPWQSTMSSASSSSFQVPINSKGTSMGTTYTP
jgi:hypothetical protein